MDDDTANAIRSWKEHCYRPTDVPFMEAVDSLILDVPLIYARQSEMRKSDWVLCRTGTTTPATFVFAGVFAEGDPYETGNLVPMKTPLPPGLDDSRVARHAGYKAAYSYAIDTYHDKDMWELQAALDAYITNVPGFNSRGVKRREWQNGSTWHTRYWFRVPMFLTCETRGGRPEPPEGLHEWVAAAHKRTKNYRANPVCPLVCGLEDGRLQSIGKCTPNVLEYGDVVSLVFGLVYVEDREDWGPVPMVTHIIRVRHANRDTYPLTSTVAVPDVLPDDAGLGVGTVVDEDQAAAADAAKAVADAAKAAADASVAKPKARNEGGKAVATTDAANANSGTSGAAGLPGGHSGLTVSGRLAEGGGPLGDGGKTEAVPLAGAVAAGGGRGTGELFLPILGGGTKKAVAAGPPVGGPTREEQGGRGSDEEDIAERSGSEMDVDDEGGPQPAGGLSVPAVEDNDDGFSSSGSTLTEETPDVTTLSGTDRGLGKGH